jgi:triosephosphate isomerase
MIVANWKMNGTRQSVTEWIDSVSGNIDIDNINPCIFCPPACYLEHARKLIEKHNNRIKLGSQIINGTNYDKPLTGGLSAKMLKDVGAEYVIIGHSEQRDFLGKINNNFLTEDVEKALSENLKIIFCVGEDFQSKENSETYLCLGEQLDALGQLHSTHENKLRSITVAYEPIWAIGSGLNAEKDYIEETHEFIKKYINDHLGWSQLDIYPAVLYGGSVNLDNCEEIISSTDVDGLLIGGASLNSETFSKIYNLS